MFDPTGPVLGPFYTLWTNKRGRKRYNSSVNTNVGLELQIPRHRSQETQIVTLRVKTYQNSTGFTVTLEFYILITNISNSHL
jgi:hypothetical protein